MGTETMSGPAGAPASSNRKKRLGTILQIGLAVVVVGAIFFGVLPQIADFSRVWAEISEMTWLEITTLLAFTAWNIVTYWLVMVAALPGLTYSQAMVVNQSSTAISNSMPGGGALGIGVTYAMYTSYGFTPSEITRSILVTGVWNNFVKLGMPVVALALLAIWGDVNAALVTAAIIGLAALAASIAIFGATLHSERLARRVGVRLGKAITPVLRLIRRSTDRDWGESLVQFRSETIGLVKKRWLWLTATTVVSHLSLYLVLLVTLRHIGASQDEVGWIQVLATFSFIRLVSALPITPGGLGVVELGLTAGLIAAGGDRAEVVAAVLVYRVLTYAIPIPFGAITYVFWQRGAARRRRARIDHPASSPAAVKGK
jgi:putative heme transporter